MNLRRLLETRQPALQLLALWGFSRVLVMFFVGRYGSDVPFYHEVAQRLASGLSPYVDFSVDHPPLALLLFRLPEALRPVLSYETAFRGMMLLVDLALFLMLALGLRASTAGDTPAARSLFLYIWLGALAFPLLYDRIDLVIAFLVLMLVWTGLWARPVWSWAILLMLPALNVGTIMLGPFWLLIERRLEGRWTASLARFAIWATAMLGFAALAPVILGPGAREFLRYHWRAPAEIQSLPASVLLAAQLIGIDQSVDVSTGALRLTGPIASKVAVSSLVLAILAVAGLWSVMAARAGADREPAAPRARIEPILAGTIAGLLGFQVSTLALLPQYILWLVPLACLARMIHDRPTADGAGSWWTALWASVVFGSVMAAPVHAEALMRLEPRYLALVLGRNLLLLVLLGWSVRRWLSPGPQAQVSTPAVREDAETGYSLRA